MQFALENGRTGTDLGLVTVKVDDVSDSAAISSYRAPPLPAGIPTISDAFDDGTLTPDDGGFPVTTRQWRNADTLASLGSGATLSGSGLGGVPVQYSPDNGLTWSPPLRVLPTTMMGSPVSAGHLADDADIIATVPHGELTHYAVADGNWTDPATWFGGRVPKNGARVLVPHGKAVTYDVNERCRLDWVRVDGTLNWAVDRSTQMLVETVIVTPGGTVTQGTSGNRLPAIYTMEVTFSGRNYRQNSFGPTDIDIRKDPGLWGRGFVSMGTWRRWGAEKTHGGKAEPMEAGATSLTLRFDPTGWAVGDDIVIGGTHCDYAEGASPMTVEDETRTITGISGRVISWSGGLAYPHRNQLAGSTRTDLYPAVILKRSRNIVFQSEVTSPAWRRAHCADVHHESTADHWDVACLNMGRTDKARPVGRKNASGDFEYHDTLTLDGVHTEPLTAQSNIASRYPVHAHHLGFGHMGARPIYRHLYVENTPGWGIVHHACDADIESCTVYDFWGSGFVAESGNELGKWDGNIAMYSPVAKSDGNLHLNAKLMEGFDGLGGNNFKFGYGFAFRGRAVNQTNNVAVSCPQGHVYYHRGRATTDPQVFPPANLKRGNLDIRDVGRLNALSSEDAEDFNFIRYPIIHFEDNEAIACLSGLHITKQAPNQQHDVNIKLKNFTSWGFYESGADIEYIGVYALEGFDIVGSDASRGYGLRLNPNVFQLAVHQMTVEGCSVGFFRDVAATSFDTTVFDDTDDPRYIDIAIDFVNCTTDYGWNNVVAAGLTDGFDIVYRDSDFDGTAIDFTQDPSDTYPMVLGTWDGSGNTITGAVDNTSGRKVTTISSQMRLAPKLWTAAPETIFTPAGLAVRLYAQNHKGYWTTDIGAGSEEVLVVQDIISDPVTARPARPLKMFRTSSTPTSSVDNGTFGYSATPVARADIDTTVARNGSVTVNPTIGATGGDGTAYKLVDGMYIAPNHGRFSFDFGTGEVTYTPTRDYAGPDKGFVFVESGGQSKTVEIRILVGPGGALTTPVADTHFAASDATDANTIDVELFDRPDAGGREITLTQYSTDAGVTWRRLCNKWKKATHKVTVESDGTAIANGSYNLRIRYKADQMTFSGASGDTPVTVT